MAANGSGLQMGTVRNLLAAWVMTLPASIALAGALFWLFNTLFAGANAPNDGCENTRPRSNGQSAAAAIT